MSQTLRINDNVNRDLYYTEEDRDKVLADIYETANVIEYLKEISRILMKLNFKMKIFKNIWKNIK